MEEGRENMGGRRATILYSYKNRSIGTLFETKKLKEDELTNKHDILRKYQPKIINYLLIHEISI